MTDKDAISTETARLNNGVLMPRVGLGVYRAPRGAETRNAVRRALLAGYRHIDTASIYGNEDDVGAAVRESEIHRADIFVTTKLWNSDQGAGRTEAAFAASLARLGLDYVDLYLLHWPVPDRRLESWRVLERLLAEGRVRAIGVSNFVVHHLEELLAVATVAPAVNQIEVHPFLQQRETRAFCDRTGIVVEAYSPLAKGGGTRHPVVAAIAERLGRTPAQVLLRWGLQHNLVVLPKSINASRIDENARLFDFVIPPREMSELDGLEEGLATGWDPRAAP